MVSDREKDFLPDLPEVRLNAPKPSVQPEDVPMAMQPVENAVAVAIQPPTSILDSILIQDDEESGIFLFFQCSLTASMTIFFCFQCMIQVNLKIVTLIFISRSACCDEFTRAQSSQASEKETPGPDICQIEK